MIEINNISKSFGKRSVLTNISFQVERGDMLCLLGPSGAGKTTLIRLIMGAIKGDQGEIRIDNRRIPNMEILRRIGFMPQNEALYPDISGRDNLRFFGGLLGLNGKRLTSAIEEMLDFVNLTPDADKLVANYSGGMKKRLSLAVALIHNPDILVLDEPTVGIDPVLRKVIWDEFNRLSRMGKTMIISTHVMDEADRCNRAALIYGGRLIAFGTVEELKKSTKSGFIEELFFTAREVKKA